MRAILSIALLLIIGCASHRAQQSTTAPSQAAFPILYHRSGGIAGTDDRVIIWPDGLVQVRGKILTTGEGWLNQDKLAQLRALAADFEAIEPPPPPKRPIPDAYIISLTYDGKSITSMDLAPNLPPAFAKLFAAIEAVAADVVNQPQLPQSTTP